MFRKNIVFSHFLCSYDTRDAFSIQMQLTFYQRKSHDTVLLIGFCKKRLIHDLREINAHSHQNTCCLHRFFRCAGILEHTGIMDDSGINAFCDLFGQTFSRDQFKYQFRRRTRLRENIVFIRKTLVTDMMIDTRCFFCMLKIFCRVSKSAPDPRSPVR